MEPLLNKEILSFLKFYIIFFICSETVGFYIRSWVLHKIGGCGSSVWILGQHLEAPMALKPVSVSWDGARARQTKSGHIPLGLLLPTSTRKPWVNCFKQYGDLLLHIVRSPETGLSLGYVASEVQWYCQQPRFFLPPSSVSPWFDCIFRPVAGWLTVSSHIHVGRCLW